MYIINFFLPCLCHRHNKYLPSKIEYKNSFYEYFSLVRRSFYFYCFVLAFINLTQIIGAVLNITETTITSMWYVNFFIDENSHFKIESNSE